MQFKPLSNCRYLLCLEFVDCCGQASAPREGIRTKTLTSQQLPGTGTMRSASFVFCTPSPLWHHVPSHHYGLPAALMNFKAPACDTGCNPPGSICNRNHQPEDIWGARSGVSPAVSCLQGKLCSPSRSPLCKQCHAVASMACFKTKQLHPKDCVHLACA